MVIQDEDGAATGIDLMCDGPAGARGQLREVFFSVPGRIPSPTYRNATDSASFIRVVQKLGAPTSLQRAAAQAQNLTISSVPASASFVAAAQRLSALAGLQHPAAQALNLAYNCGQWNVSHSAFIQSGGQAVMEKFEEHLGHGFVNLSLFPSTTAILLGMASVCILFGCMRAMNCRLRDCWCCCCAKFLRCCCCQTPEFQITMIVHTVECLDVLTSTWLSVAATADRAKDETVACDMGVFETTLTMVVEQGVSPVLVEVLDSSKNVLAHLRLDTAKDILGLDGVDQKTFKMQQVSKSFRGPTIRLSVFVEGREGGKPGGGGSRCYDAVNTMAHEGGLSVGLRAMLLHTANQEDMEAGQHQDSRSKLQVEIDILAASVAGRLGKTDILSLGKTIPVWVDVVGPPNHKRFDLRIFQEKGGKDTDSKRVPDHTREPIGEADLLKVCGIAPDPTRPNFFALKYMDKDKNIAEIHFERKDRGRDIWVEQLDLIITKVRELKDHKSSKKEKEQKKEKKSKRDHG